MYEKYLNKNYRRKILESDDDFPGSRDQLKNLLYSLKGVSQHSDELIRASKEIKGLSSESLKVAEELVSIYKKYSKNLEKDLRTQTELLRDFYKAEGDESMAEYYENFLK